jgi:enamine deaminase RidA (YjgF/YER057c/UK114 family)
MTTQAVAKKKRITSPKVGEPAPGLWSNCWVVGNQLILAGMVPWDKNGALVGGNDPYAQSIAAFENMKALVEAAGAKMSDLVKINVYLTDMRFRPAFIEARKKFFTGDFPAAVVIGNVTLASPDLLVEFDAWGFIGCGD